MEDPDDDEMIEIQEKPKRSGKHIRSEKQVEAFKKAQEKRIANAKIKLEAKLDKMNEKSGSKPPIKASNTSDVEERNAGALVKEIIVKKPKKKKVIYREESDSEEEVVIVRRKKEQKPKQEPEKPTLPPVKEPEKPKFAPILRFL